TGPWRRWRRQAYRRRMRAFETTDSKGSKEPNQRGRPLDVRDLKSIKRAPRMIHYAQQTPRNLHLGQRGLETDRPWTALPGLSSSWVFSYHSKGVTHMKRSWKIAGLVAGALLVNAQQASADLKSVFTAVCRASDDPLVTFAGPTTQPGKPTPVVCSFVPPDCR